MKKWKIILISFLCFFSYVFAFFYTWGFYLSISLIILLFFVLIIPQGGRIKFTIFTKIWESLKMKRYKDFIPNKDSTIAIGMSGGVDSSVSAYLLKKQGYNVIGFFMRNWDSSINEEWNHILSEEEICQQEKDFQDAKKVADQLGIKLIKLNFVQQYWDDVFSRFLKELKIGITPNPDIFCNRYIKFDYFINHIQKNYPEIDYIATGHYAKIKQKDNKKYLFKAEDTKKDQTYFLSEIKKDALNKVFFPLANFLKSDVRKIAEEANLYTKDKKDSVGICFIGKRNFPKFISNYLKEKEGNIVDQKTNKILGKHKGVIFYTIGQRRGLGISGKENPYFVSKKDMKNNILYVSNDEEKYLYKDNIKTSDFKLLIGNDLLNFIKDKKDVQVKTRHSEIIYKAVLKDIFKKENKINLEIKTKEKIKAITPGQELVVYYNDICIGGGQIAHEL